MWTKFGKQNALCVEFREALEDLRAEVSEAQGQAALENSLSAEALAHADRLRIVPRGERDLLDFQGIAGGVGRVDGQGITGDR